jgi:hypothetical protein
MFLPSGCADFKLWKLFNSKELELKFASNANSLFDTLDNLALIIIAGY